MRINLKCAPTLIVDAQGPIPDSWAFRASNLLMVLYLFFPNLFYTDKGNITSYRGVYINLSNIQKHKP